MNENQLYSGASNEARRKNFVSIKRDWNDGREEGVSHQQPIRDTGQDSGSQRSTLSALSKIQCVLELSSRHKEEGGSDRP